MAIGQQRSGLCTLDFLNQLRMPGICEKSRAQFEPYQRIAITPSPSNGPLRSRLARRRLNQTGCSETPEPDEWRGDTKKGAAGKEGKAAAKEEDEDESEEDVKPKKGKGKAKAKK
ncbi:hypothetical protein KC318_g1835 [Hortaea werneckii]|nr:hypothetical protein KC334_g1700 [Hortaea werneckii]KAI7021655.1 hypothetical protein KC355_g2290 [Hortaea werneckii]KAI7674064.1 hypothetical protein KC318_g1835 [Hortaea werneckii]